MALVAEEEAKAVSTRTKAALAAAKARGTKLGGWRGGPVADGKLGAAALVTQANTFASSVRPTIQTMQQADGLSLHAIAKRLTAQGIKTARGGEWNATTVRNIMARAQSTEPVTPCD